MSVPRPARQLAWAWLLGSVVCARPLAGGERSSRVQTPDLAQPVTVTTDRWGIPHIRAGSLDDLYYAWGWVAARDRLWQMVWMRAGGDGQTHRWLGNSALQLDGGAQLFRLRERSHAIWERERGDSTVRTALERFAAGVNRYLGECRRGERRWPAEISRLHMRPADWRPEDSVLLLLGFGVTLDLDLPELSEARAVAQHGTAWVEERGRFEDRWVYDTIPDSAAARMWSRNAGGPRAAREPTRPSLSPSLLAAADQVMQAFPAHEPDGAGRASNAFVVGGKRSAGGKPILANDPHLGLATPGPLHVVHVAVPGVVDAVGAGAAGLPVIVIGRNPRAAWGVTALSADVVDVFADTLSADNRRVRTHSARGRAGWAPVKSLPFDLHYRVLGLRIQVPSFLQARRYSPHGPMLVWDPKRHLALSARWSALEDSRITLGRLIGLERSRSAAEVCERMATLVTPCFNVMAADVDGDARYRGVGLLPIRAAVPGPGPIPSNGRYEWTGFIPAEKMPQWRVPASGFAANGNNRPVGRRYPYALPRFEWLHDRARRMAQRLEGDRSVTVADAASIQNDVFSLAADRYVRQLLRCADSLRATLPPRSRAALDTLRAWDDRAVRSRVAPTLYRAWFGAYQRRSRLEGYPGLALAALMGRAPGALRVPGRPAELEAPSVAARGALAMALDTLAAKLGPDLSTWTYARAHKARFRHALSALDPRSRWEPPLLPEDGDNATPSVGPSRLPWSIEVTHGAAFRHIVDLSQPRVSWGVVPPWNSAAFAREADLGGRWADHGYVPLHLDPARIAEVAIDRVTLGP
jgi:penicillin amidase